MLPTAILAKSLLLYATNWAIRVAVRREYTVGLLLNADGTPSQGSVEWVDLLGRNCKLSVEWDESGNVSLLRTDRAAGKSGTTSAFVSYDGSGIIPLDVAKDVIVGMVLDGFAVDREYTEL